MPTILIVDDETPIREMIEVSLELSGFDCLEADSANSAMPIILNDRPNLILLDWMMPGVSGLEFLRRIRRDGSIKDIPVILLTAKDGDQNSVQALNSGADDYIRKPFSPDELLARIKSVLRRANGYAEGQTINAGPISLDPTGHQVNIGNTEVRIGPTEYKLLNFFLTHQDRPYSREQLLDRVWGGNVYIDERTVDVHIRRLRKTLNSIEGFELESFIQTVRGIGYRFSTKLSN